MKVYALVVGESKKHELEVGTAESAPRVDDVRKQVFACDALKLRPDTHHVRLIAAGRVLNDAAALLDSVGVKDGMVIHVQVADAKILRDRDVQGAAERHCATTGSTDSDSTSPAHPPGMHVVEMGELGGQSDEDISNYRLQYMLELMQAEDDESFLLEDGMLEEPGGSWIDFVWGFMIGFLFGVIMIILARDQTIRLSRIWRSGILFGVSVNVILGMFMLVAEKRHRI
ncbi:hypothetical protein FVE85_0916 [Porphyridium purpureum]|uniref:DSC E3 ubiquitin ligase complex subunit 3 C-terminal domain-containing protein n=1 Tax=Porphyridium purpureum TaxID=35688 RepID=A0A5J4Z3I6_PORPP|nr:hypothetical protein FVE85_0916 [Porphyridium purpureum]|eukprot:POR3516..scf208_2